MTGEASTGTGHRRASGDGGDAENTANSAGKDAKNHALRLLARREYSAKELRDTLTAKGHALTPVESAIHQLQAQNLQSDQRFAEAYSRSRQQRGFGPLRIQQELKQKGIDAELINQVLNNCETPWEQAIEKVRAKRFGNDLPSDNNDIAKQMRFLNYRGFPPELVHWLMKHGLFEVD